ncbi:PREDICTED: glutamate receptor 2.7-like [Nelumbo nucifera]|uniref:Glutamate receptor 2.7-like n=1 Tax=Nelumbo nucifera TaxID=4432 RepID=A0A1U8A9P0_NELNU|nr:PREDICTED: glutamate receptor 2.7-like [Nelumbo nucifera]
MSRSLPGEKEVRSGRVWFAAWSDAEEGVAAGPEAVGETVVDTDTGKLGATLAADKVEAAGTAAFDLLTCAWNAAIDLLQNLEVRAIIGPETAALTNFIVDLGDRTHVPIISFSVNSLFSSLIPSPYFIQAVQNEVSQVKVISTMIQAFGWRAATLIYEDTDYGSGIIPYLTDAFQEIDISISYKSVISISATDDQILKELYKLMTMQTRVFIVHMYSTLGSRLFLKAKEVGMITRGYAWIITSRLANLIDSVDSSVLDSMQGVLGVRSYIPRSRKLDDFIFRWKTNDVENRQTMGSGKINIFGLWAYDAAWALAVAVERTERVNSYFQRPSIDKGLTNLLTLGISPVGPKLLNEILKAEFKGLGGEFHFINGQLQPSRLQIINVNGREEKEIACWSPSNDLSGGPNLNSTKTYAFFLASLKSPVVWPGKSTEVPRGWEMPTSGKKLRIGVPVWGFKEFVNMEKNVYNNSTKFSGFCIDLFEAVVKELPYALPFEFVPFSGSYDDLIYQVYLQETMFPATKA